MIAHLPGLNAVPHTPMDDLCMDFVNSRFNDHRGTGSVYAACPCQAGGHGWSSAGIWDLARLPAGLSWLSSAGSGRAPAACSRAGVSRPRVTDAPSTESCRLLP